MTAQVAEKIWYQGNTMDMVSLPLEVYFRLGGHRPRFLESNTALWRGYVGEWEIHDRRLYLVGLTAKLHDGQPASLDSVFPGCGERVYAHWYCGQLRMPMGRLLRHVNAGFASVHEQDLLLEVRRGLVVAEKVCRNTAAHLADALTGYPTGVMTVWDIPQPLQAGK
jgi:hypothetical protein